MKRTALLALLVFGVGTASAQSPPTQADETPAHQTLRARKEASEARLARADEERTTLEKQSAENYEREKQVIAKGPPYDTRIINEGIVLANQRLAVLQKIIAIKRDLDRATAQVDHVDDCTRIYRETIDAKQSDLTTRQAGQIAACKSLDLYPFAAP